MPPPPVAGAAVGTGLACAPGVAGAGVAGRDAGRPADGLALTPAEPLAVLPAEAAGVGEVGAAGENEVGTGEGLDAVQPETAAEISMVMVLQPMTASLALCLAPAMVVRTLMAPPHASGRWRSRFRAPARQTGSRKRKRVPAAAVAARGRSPAATAAIKAGPTDGTGMR